MSLGGTSPEYVLKLQIDDSDVLKTIQKINKAFGGAVRGGSGGSYSTAASSDIAKQISKVQAGIQKTQQRIYRDEAMRGFKAMEQASKSALEKGSWKQNLSGNIKKDLGGLLSGKLSSWLKIIPILGVLMGIQKGIEILRKASPLLDSILSIFETSFMLMIRPFGDLIALALKPLAILMLKFAIRFYKVAHEFFKDPIKALHGVWVNILNWGDFFKAGEAYAETPKGGAGAVAESLPISDSIAVIVENFDEGKQYSVNIKDTLAITTDYFRESQNEASKTKDSATNINLLYQDFMQDTKEKTGIMSKSTIDASNSLSNIKQYWESGRLTTEQTEKLISNVATAWSKNSVSAEETSLITTQIVDIYKGIQNKSNSVSSYANEVELSFGKAKDSSQAASIAIGTIAGTIILTGEKILSALQTAVSKVGSFAPVTIPGIYNYGIEAFGAQTAEASVGGGALNTVEKLAAAVKSSSSKTSSSSIQSAYNAFKSSASKSTGTKSIFSSWGKYANGGWINEPVIGMGLRTGMGYSIGEAGREMVVPEGKMGNMGGITVNVTVNASGISNSFDMEQAVKQAVLKAMQEVGIRTSGL